MITNKDKFCEVFGAKTYETMMHKFKTEEMTDSDIYLWLLSKYVSDEVKKKRGRKPKEATNE